jgi:hypothetical protein
LELLALPTAFSLGAINQSLALLAVAACATWTFRRGGCFRSSLPFTCIALATLGVYAVALPRPSVLAALVVGGVVVFRQDQSPSALSSFIDGIGLYLLANLIARFGLGIESPLQQARLDSSLTSSTGLFGQRLLLPLTTSLVVPSVMAALYLAGGVYQLLTNRVRRSYRLVCICAAIFILLATDARVSIVVGTVLLAFALTRPTALARMAVAIAICSMALPFVYESAKPSVQHVVSAAADVAPLLSRKEDASNLGGLNNRDVIWSQGQDAFAGLPLGQRLIGSGPEGQISSGVSASYSSLFVGGYADPSSAGLHSSSLQELVDGGWIGLMLFASAAVLAVRRWARIASESKDSLGLIVLLGLLCTGATEGILAPGTGSVCFVALVVIVRLAPNPKVQNLPSDAIRVRPARGAPVDVDRLTSCSGDRCK